MVIKIIGLIIGVLILFAGIYYLVKEKMIQNPKRFTQ